MNSPWQRLNKQAAVRHRNVTSNWDSKTVASAAVFSVQGGVIYSFVISSRSICHPLMPHYH